MKQGKNIKTKSANTQKKGDVRRLPSVLIRKLLLRSRQGAVSQLKEGSMQGRRDSSSAGSGSGDSNAPANYAEDQLIAGAERVSRETASQVYRAGKKLAKDTKEKIRETRRILKDAENWGQRTPQGSSGRSLAHPSGQGRDSGLSGAPSHQHSLVRHPGKSIKTKPAKSMKTLRWEVRQGKQAAKTAQTSAKAAKQAERAVVQTEKAAVQAAKQAPKMVKAAGQAAKAAVKAAKEAAHAIVSAVKAGVSAIKSGVAAVLAVILICAVVLIVMATMGIGQPPAWSGTGPMFWPLPGECSISSHFGTRADPFTGDISLHSGVDVAASEGTAILAAADGVVEFVNGTDLWGQGNSIYFF